MKTHSKEGKLQSEKTFSEKMSTSRVEDKHTSGRDEMINDGINKEHFAFKNGSLHKVQFPLSYRDGVDGFQVCISLNIVAFCNIFYLVM